MTTKELICRLIVAGALIALGAYDLLRGCNG